MGIAAFLSFPPTMAWPLLGALALAGILVYFGIHVIGRKVIFVDLALAQIAALGTAVGVLMGYELEHSPWQLFAYSFGFTLLAALVFSITKRKSDDIPHEAIIGITYAVAVAATMIVLAKSPLGPQEFDRMMKGQLLWVKEEQVKIAAVLYAGIGLFHFLFRKKFMPLSFGEEGAVRGRWFWDFLFYGSFGFVVTSSVAMAGVFLVFCMLVIPAVGALLFARRTWIRLTTGWGGAGLLCVLGIRVSYETGWPTSPVIVVAFAGALLLAAIVRHEIHLWRAHEFRPWLLRQLRDGAIVGVLGLFFVGVFFFRHRGEDPFDRAVHLAHGRAGTERLSALNAFEALPERRSDWLPHVRTLLGDSNANVRLRALELLVRFRQTGELGSMTKLLRDKEDHVRERAADLLHELGEPRVTGDLIGAGDAERESDIKVRMYEVALEFGEKRAVDRLLAVLEDEDFPRRRKEKAYKVLAPHVDFSFAPGEVARFKKWWAANRARAVWRDREGRRMFTLELK